MIASHRLLIALCLLTCHMSSPMAQPTNVSAHLTQQQNNTYHITCTLQATEKQFVRKNNIKLFASSPDVHITDWQIRTEAKNYYDTVTKETVQIFPNEVTLEVTAQAPTAAAFEQAHLQLSYYRGAENEPVQEIVQMPRMQQSAELTTAIETAAPIVPVAPATAQQPAAQSWSDSLSALIKASSNIWLRCLLVFLLGILMSLTPCIYPMIPITMGILQAQGSKSVLRNFSLALTYTMGIATTFACLGVLAVFTGQVFGTILANPIFVMVLVLLLAYLAGSMFGLYEMYIPRFMQQTNTETKGSYTSTFLFGAVSGSIASPCLSPGLVLLLTLVSTLGSKLLGFVLLFAFGIGLGVPLLIIGTFSSSLSVLPRAGMWMIEIKKFFGFMLLALCFHFLRAIVAWHFLLWGIALFVLASGVYYLYSVSSADAWLWRVLKNCIGVGCTAGSIMLFVQAFLVTQELRYPTHHVASCWHTDYDAAYAQAQREGKKLFIDIGADCCSLCTAIDCTVMKDNNVLNALDQYVCLKINGSDSNNPAFAKIRQHHPVIGFPTFLLIDPNTNLQVASWGGELYSKPRTDFVQDLKTYVC